MEGSSGKKPQLPFGWVVHTSKTYRDRVYYFNVYTKQTTWDLSDLLSEESVKNGDEGGKHNLALESIEGTTESPQTVPKRKALPPPAVHRPPTSITLYNQEAREKCLKRKRPTIANGGIPSQSPPNRCRACSDSEKSIPWRCTCKDNESEKSDCEVKVEMQPVRTRKWRRKSIDNSSEQSRSPPKKVRLDRSSFGHTSTNSTDSKASTVILPNKELNLSEKAASLTEEINRELKYVASVIQKTPTEEPKVEKLSSIIDDDKSVIDISCSTDDDKSDVEVKEELVSEDDNSQIKVKYVLVSDDDKSEIEEKEELVSDNMRLKSEEVPALDEGGMEWEEVEEEKIEQEKMILDDIQEFRSQHQDDMNQPPDPTVFSDHSSKAPECKNGEWFIVLDTNILLSHLGFVEELRDTNFKDSGYPVLIIPWMVLQELDKMKGWNASSKYINMELRARRAVNFLNSNFTSAHPRVRGQTAVDAEEREFSDTVPDDRIIHCCVQLIRKKFRVLLMSNDNNLRNKALVNNIEAYSKEEFEALLLRPKQQQDIKKRRRGGKNKRKAQCTVVMSLPNQEQQRGEFSRSDEILCKLKALLKEPLSMVLQTEMENVFDDKWKYIVSIKPPWALPEIFKCFRKHWVAVFGYILPRDTKILVESLYQFFNDGRTKKGYGHSLNIIKDVLETSLDFCTALFDNTRMRKVKCSLEDCIKGIKELLQDCETQLEMATRSCRENMDTSSVLAVFQQVYNVLHNCSCSVYDALGLNHNYVYDRQREPVDLKVVRTLLPSYNERALNLMKCIESVLQTPANLLSVDSESIIGLYNALGQFDHDEIHLDVEEMISPELLLAFCTNTETRNLLVTGGKQIQGTRKMLYTAGMTLASQRL